ncbi:MAG TPA: hypothetical protein VEJ43_15980 [Pseudolabrys sp.]|nr:hypothetical protein [Pseudolabrys sp.]
MIDHSPTSGTISRVMALALPISLFAIVLLFGIFVLLRYAHAWVAVLGEAAATTAPMAGDGVVALVSTLVTVVGVVWLYSARLAR